jgi:hypothetical protein
MIISAGKFYPVQSPLSSSPLLLAQSSCVPPFRCRRFVSIFRLDPSPDDKVGSVSRFRHSTPSSGDLSNSFRYGLFIVVFDDSLSVSSVQFIWLRIRSSVVFVDSEMSRRLGALWAPNLCTKKRPREADRGHCIDEPVRTVQARRYEFQKEVRTGITSFAAPVMDAYMLLTTASSTSSSASVTKTRSRHHHVHPSCLISRPTRRAMQRPNSRMLLRMIRLYPWL